MKRYIHQALVVCTALLLSACNSFLDREPLDFDDEEAFFQNAEQLKWFVNDLYGMLPVNNTLWGGLYTQDIVSDNQCASSPQSLLYKGDKRTVKIANSEWNFSNLRSLNYYINKVEGKIAGGELNGADPEGVGLFPPASEFRRCTHHHRDVSQRPECAL